MNWKWQPDDDGGEVCGLCGQHIGHVWRVEDA